MYFKLYHDPKNKTLTIPRAALQLSQLTDVEELILHTGSGGVLTARDALSAGECLHLLNFLTSITSSLLLQLAMNSREEDSCSDETTDDDSEDETTGLTIPRWLLERAGLDARECLEAFAENGRVIVAETQEENSKMKKCAGADKEKDPLRAFDRGFCDMLRIAGVDLENLRRQLRQEELEDE